DARDDDREASHQRRRMASPPTETSKARAPMTIAAITSVCIESRRAESSAFAATRSGNCSWSVETTPSNVFGPDSKRSSAFVEPPARERMGADAALFVAERDVRGEDEARRDDGECRQRREHTRHRTLLGVS